MELIIILNRMLIFAVFCFFYLHTTLHFLENDAVEGEDATAEKSKESAVNDSKDSEAPTVMNLKQWLNEKVR